MLKLRKITTSNGFDALDLDNGRQNNYAWSMEELGEHIYVGTGRNIILQGIMTMPNLKAPLDLSPNILDNTGEIWRYRKDNSYMWERVLKTDPSDNIRGFRFMIKYDSFGIKPALYAAGMGETIKIYKSTNGVNWFPLSNDINDPLIGTSSRAMVVHNGKLYIATGYDSDPSTAYIYSSTDPELEGWTLETPQFPSPNMIQGSVQLLESFNEHLYASTISDEGICLWRTIGSEPSQGGWKLVLDKGGGDASNNFPGSIGIYRNHLYLGSAVFSFSTKGMLSPKGAELFRIDINDNWELIVGNISPENPTTPTTGQRNFPISGCESGFNNKFNFYMWQVKAYADQLLVGTFDNSSMVEPYLELLLKNRDLLISSGMSLDAFNSVVDSLKEQIFYLKMNKNKIGFDLYRSIDGESFTPITLNGLGNPYNYGSRILFTSDNGKLYIGTANPFQGCEVWETPSFHNEYM